MGDNSQRQYTIGLIYGLLAYGWWGFVPVLFFKAVRYVDSYEIVAHRIVWSLPLLLIWLGLSKRLAELPDAFRNWRVLRLLLLSTFFIGLNWLVYIHCVVNDQVVQGSLGYFINPLINVVLGVLIFRERLRPVQWSAVGLAAIGVVLMTVSKGQLPWIALTLALAFGFYGMIRKATPVDGVVGLSVEVSLLFPLCSGYILFLMLAGQSSFGFIDRRTDVLLLLNAVVTVFPLVCFGQAARKLPLTALGFIQYLAPTAQFMLGVFMYGEQLNLLGVCSFVLIWVGLALYSADTLRAYQSRRETSDEVLAPDAKQSFPPCVPKRSLGTSEFNE